MQRIAFLVRRVHQLERQLQARGEVPAPTLTGEELREVAQVLEALATGTGKGLARWNTLELRMLAAAVRGMALYG